MRQQSPALQRKYEAMTFENGLPRDGAEVEVKTVWNTDWVEMTFRGRVSSLWPDKGSYGWFGVYAEPDMSLGSRPIVTEWRYPQPN